MNILDTYFSIMGSAPTAAIQYLAKTAPPKPAPVDNSAAARQKAAENKKRGRSALISNEGGAQGLGDDASKQKKTLGGY